MQRSPIPSHTPDFATWGVQARQSGDGCWYVRPNVELGPYPATLPECLERSARLAPQRLFLAEREGSSKWRTISYAQFRQSARAVAQWLLDRKMTRERPIAILSGNDIDHALLAVGAMYCGIPYAPISPAYSQVAGNLERLMHVMDVLAPGLVFAANGDAFAHAIREVVPRDAELVIGEDAPVDRASTPFETLVAAHPTSAVDQALAAIAPESVAKILFTSGSTGVPKGVITTHRMLCSNQEMLRTLFPFFNRQPPVICDWLPWHHTFGGSHNFGLVLYNAGTLYIDRGKPMREAFDESLRNLREVAPTVYFNVPKGFELLVEHLKADSHFREHFFSRLQMAFYAAAGLPQHIWDAFDGLAMDTVGRRIPMLTGLGATETAPMALCARPDNRRAGVVGLPVPGVELKLTPVNEKLEACIRGPNVTPGFWREPELTRGSFDEEGYYRMGDALTFVDMQDPARGFRFDGRIAEDFKLSTGTWVSVGPLRAHLIQHCAPWVRDVVIAGHDRDEVTALIFPDSESYARLEASGRAREVFAGLLGDLGRQSTGSSNRIVRAMVMTDGPSAAAGEVTDKGSLNQRAVLRHRAEIVEQLYANPAPREVIVAGY